MHLIRLFSMLPGGWSEEVRVMVSDLHLGRMLSVLTDNCSAWKAKSEKGPSSASDE